MNSTKKTGLSLGVIFFIFSVLVMNASYANETEIKAYIKGSFQKIQQQQKDTVFIVTFWSETCAFCMEELAMFGKTLSKHPNVKLVSITTDPFLESETINNILASKKLDNAGKWVFSDDYVVSLFFDTDKSWRGELPLTYFFGRDKKLTKHLGTINQNELNNWLLEQSVDS